MRLRPLLLITSYFMCSLAPFLGQIASARGEPGPAAEVRAVLDSQVAAWNRGDLEGYMAGYWRSPLLTFYSGGTVTTGWQPTLDRYRRRYQGEGRAMGKLSFEGVQIEPVGADAALARGRWVLQFAEAQPDRAGKQSKQIGGLFSVLFKRQPEGFRIVHDHSSSD